VPRHFGVDVITLNENLHDRKGRAEEDPVRSTATAVFEPTWLMPLAAARRIAPLCNTLRHRDSEMSVRVVRLLAAQERAFALLRYSSRKPTLVDAVLVLEYAGLEYGRLGKHGRQPGSGRLRQAGRDSPDPTFASSSPGRSRFSLISR
jgi:hypothetical protein